MRSALGKELRKQFGKAISQAFPGFLEAKVPSARPGARLYVHATPEAAFFIRLVPNPENDWFTVHYGWSASGEPPTERISKWHPEDGTDPLADEGYEFRIFEVGGWERRWILDDPADVAFERTLQEFSKAGDSPEQALERAATEGFGYITSVFGENPVEKLLPKLPVLIADCMKCVRETVMPYFDEVRELKSHRDA